MIRAVLFDMDGLLFDSEAFYKAIWQEETARLGFDLHDGLYAKLVGVPNAVCERYLTEWFPGFPLAEFQKSWRAIRDDRRAAQGIPLKAGALELVTWLAEQGVPMGLATSSSQGSVARNRSHAPELFRFSTIMTIDKVSRPKPDPQIYELTAESLAVPLSACVIFEDSNPGMRAAIASGAAAIMIPDLATPESDVLAGATNIYPSLLEAQAQHQDWLRRA